MNIKARKAAAKTLIVLQKETCPHVITKPKNNVRARTMHSHIVEDCMRNRMAPVLVLRFVALRSTVRQTTRGRVAYGWQDPGGIAGNAASTHLFWRGRIRRLFSAMQRHHRDDSVQRVL